MTAKKQEQPASFRLIACAALAISPLLGATSMAADNHFHVGAPFPHPRRKSAAKRGFRPPVLPPQARRIPATANPMTEWRKAARRRGRLRLRPKNFGGL